MKITLVYLGRSGAGPLYSFEMARELAKNNNMQLLLSETIENKEAWKAHFGGMENVEIVFFKTYKNIVTFILSSLNPMNYIQIIGRVKRFKPDVVYSPFLHLWSPVFFAFLQKYKIYSTIHDVKIHLGENKLLYPPYIAAIKLSHKIIILNSESRNDALNLGFKKSEICVIPHASFSRYKRPEKDKSNYLHKNILFVGRIEKYKGLDILLEAFQEVIEHDIDISLTIAGRGDLKRYQDKISKYSTSLNVINRWLSEDEIIELLGDCDFVVLPYVQASQSGIVPMAFAYGKTVIVTNVGGLPEQVPDGTGLVVDPSAQGLRDGILYLYESDDRIVRLSKAAQLYSEKYMSWSRSSEKLLQFFH